MFKRNIIDLMARMKRGYAGLPRRKVCIRAVHHIFRSKLDAYDGSEKNDEEPP